MLLKCSDRRQLKAGVRVFSVELWNQTPPPEVTAAYLARDLWPPLNECVLGGKRGSKWQFMEMRGDLSTWWVITSTLILIPPPSAPCLLLFSLSPTFKVFPLRTSISSTSHPFLPPSFLHSLPSYLPFSTTLFFLLPSSISEPHCSRYLLCSISSYRFLCFTSPPLRLSMPPSLTEVLSGVFPGVLRCLTWFSFPFVFSSLFLSLSMKSLKWISESLCSARRSLPAPRVLAPFFLPFKPGCLSLVLIPPSVCLTSSVSTWRLIGPLFQLLLAPSPVSLCLSSSFH